MTRLEALKIMQLGPEFTEQDLKTSFREKAKKAHPDRSGQDEDFKLLKQAYEFLKNLKNSPFDQVEPDIVNVELDIDESITLTFLESCVGCIKSIVIDRHELYTSTSGCPICLGRGWICRESSPIVKCNVCAKGKPPRKTKKTIRIPAGIHTGNTLTFNSEGNSLDGRSGSLNVKIKVKKSDYLSRQNLDIVQIKDVKYSDLLLGKSLVANTVHGDVKVEIPYGSFDGDALRIKGRGIKTKNSAGSHVVKLRLVSPSQLNNDQREALENLRRVGL